MFYNPVAMEGFARRAIRYADACPVAHKTLLVAREKEYPAFVEAVVEPFSREQIYGIDEATAKYGLHFISYCSSLSVALLSEDPKTGRPWSRTLARAARDDIEAFPAKVATVQEIAQLPTDVFPVSGTIEMYANLYLYNNARTRARNGRVTAFHSDVASHVEAIAPHASQDGILRNEEVKDHMSDRFKGHVDAFHINGLSEFQHYLIAENTEQLAAHTKFLLHMRDYHPTESMVQYATDAFTRIVVKDLRERHLVTKRTLTRLEAKLARIDSRSDADFVGNEKPHKEEENTAIISFPQAK